MIAKYRRLKEKEMIKLEAKYINNDPLVVAIVQRLDEAGDPLPPSEYVYSMDSLKSHKTDYEKNYTQQRETKLKEIQQLEKEYQTFVGDYEEFEQDFIAVKEAFERRINDATSFVSRRLPQLEKASQEKAASKEQVS